MERVIKFRGKRVDNDEWIYGGIWISKANDYYIITADYLKIKERSGLMSIGVLEDETHMHWVKRDTVGQFTGRTDDGGDDLYDGDIISFDYELESYIGVIKWFAETNEFVVTPNGWSISLSLYEIDDAVTKLGNIHDNPELLEVTQNN